MCNVCIVHGLHPPKATSFNVHSRKLRVLTLNGEIHVVDLDHESSTSRSSGFVYSPMQIGLPVLHPIGARLVSSYLRLMQIRRLRSNGNYGNSNVPIDVNTMVQYNSCHVARRRIKLSKEEHNIVSDVSKWRDYIPICQIIMATPSIFRLLWRISWNWLH